MSGGVAWARCLLNFLQDMELWAFTSSADRVPQFLPQRVSVSRTDQSVAVWRCADEIERKLPIRHAPRRRRARPTDPPLYPLLADRVGAGELDMRHAPEGGDELDGHLAEHAREADVAAGLAALGDEWSCSDDVDPLEPEAFGADIGDGDTLDEAVGDGARDADPWSPGGDEPPPPPPPAAAIVAVDLGFGGGRDAGMRPGKGNGEGSPGTGIPM